MTSTAVRETNVNAYFEQAQLGRECSLSLENARASRCFPSLITWMANRTYMLGLVLQSVDNFSPQIMRDIDDCALERGYLSKLSCLKGVSKICCG